MTGIKRAAHPMAVACLSLLVSGCAAGTSTDDSSPTEIPSPSVSPSPAASTAARPLRDTGSDLVLTPGTYVVRTFPVDLTFDIPEGDGPGWHVGKATSVAAILIWYTPGEPSWAVGFWIVDNVYVDPCDSAAGELDPPVGPLVEDLVTALSAMPGFEASAPVDVTVGAFEGKQIDLTVLDSGADCAEALLWSAGEDKTDMAPGSTTRVLIVDVDGVRVVINTFFEHPDAVAEAQLRQILDSIRTDPGS